MEKIPKHVKATAFTEKSIVEKIISGIWKSGDTLPPERELSEMLGITRPTLRETLQRLASEGWITISHGKPTIINDYMNDGSLAILRTLAKHSDFMPLQIINDWLEFRVMILPAIAQKAVYSNSSDILNILLQKPTIKSKSSTFCDFDWLLQESLVKFSGNSVALMLYNDLKSAYISNSEKYFRIMDNKKSSVEFYNFLEKTITENVDNVNVVVKTAMEKSITNFKNSKN